VNPGPDRPATLGGRPDSKLRRTFSTAWAVHRRAWLVLDAAILLPLVPWILVGSLDERFSGREALHSVANLAAFFAISAWAANLVLASRIRPLERAVGGLEQLYGMHRRVGVVVVTLAVVHVVFVTVYAGAEALDLYLPSAGWSVFSGVVAFALLVGFLAATIAGRLSYPAFILVQRLMGGAFVLGAFHAFAVRGTAASSPGLTIVLGSMTAAGIASLLYRVVGGRVGAGRHRYRVQDVRRLGEDVVEIVMSPLGRALEFQAGQFLYATFNQPGIPRESHPFTISSAPGADLRIAVKRFGDYTRLLMDLRPGAQALLEGPFGSFQLLGDSLQAQTWIAGGIGITPFLSWARTLDGSIPVDLYYCTPAAEQAHFLDELFAIADRHPRLRVVPIRKSSLGRLSVDDIEAVNPRVCSGHVFICGPQVMIDNMRDGFTARGMGARRIHSECFDFR
jgi:predicted ferric reductase